MKDGSRITSQTHQWPDVPDGILVVRWWGPRGKGVNWGDGLYGDPATLKQAGYVPDDEFARVLAEAKATKIPPSKR